MKRDEILLNKRIKYMRTSNNMSQAQLAVKLNISPSTIGMYEQGRRTPDIETLICLAREFDVSLDFLLTGKEYTPMKDEKQEKLYFGHRCCLCQHYRDSYKSGNS